jgi:predicted O-methyltransferase YrrM
MKHFYEDIGENWFSYAQFYHDMVQKLKDGSRIAEIGCWKGRSSVCLGVEIVNSHKAIDFYCIDSWKYVKSTEQPVSSQEMFDIVYYEFLQNIRPIDSYINVIRDNSIDASTLFQKEFFDFIFIDASHHYSDVFNDNKYWLPKLKPGGIIAGHDYFTDVHPGVKEAVDETYGKLVKTIPEQNVWYYEKQLNI